MDLFLNVKKTSRWEPFFNMPSSSGHEVFHGLFLNIRSGSLLLDFLSFSILV